MKWQPEQGERSDFGFGERVAGDARDRSLDERITDSLVQQLHGQYGWSRDTAVRYAATFLSGDRASRTVDQLANLYPLDGLEVFELGTGLGGVLLEMRRRNIRATGLEPSEEWCEIVRGRLKAEGLGEDCVVRGVGESLPFPDESFDLVVSMQVLEHTQDPEGVLREIDRVLRPSGVAVITAPNYMSFRENHYRVRWIPGLTTRTGSWYLSLLGRDPDFYQRHVNNLTYRSVMRVIRALGWSDLRWERRVAKAGRERRLFAPCLRTAPGTMRWIYQAAKTFRSEMNLHFRKQA